MDVNERMRTILKDIEYCKDAIGVVSNKVKELESDIEHIQSEQPSVTYEQKEMFRQCIFNYCALHGIKCTFENWGFTLSNIYFYNENSIKFFNNDGNRLTIELRWDDIKDLGKTINSCIEYIRCTVIPHDRMLKSLVK